MRNPQIPPQSGVTDVERLRSDLREAFDDFIARATAVMDQYDQYLERLQ